MLLRTQGSEEACLINFKARQEGDGGENVYTVYKVYMRTMYTKLPVIAYSKYEYIWVLGSWWAVIALSSVCPENDYRE